MFPIDRIFISLGSNVDHRRKYLAAARFQMANRGLRLVQKSQIYQTQAWGMTDQSPFLNQIVEITTELSPFELLQLLKSIEVSMGRKPREKWTKREIDLDIIYYGHQIVKSLELQIPHPYLYQRKFVLVPLCEIAPDFSDPQVGKTVKELASENTDQSHIELYKPRR